MSERILPGWALTRPAVYFGPADSIAGHVASLTELRDRLRCACLLFDHVIIPLSYVYDDHTCHVLHALELEHSLIRHQRILLSMRSTFPSLRDASSHLREYALRQTTDEQERQAIEGHFDLTTDLLRRMDPTLVHFDARRTEGYFRHIVTQALDLTPLVHSNLRPLRDQTLERLAEADFLTRTAARKAVSIFPERVAEAARTLVTASYYVSGSDSVSSTILATPRELGVLSTRFQLGIAERALVPYLEGRAMSRTLAWSLGTIGDLAISYERLVEITEEKFEQLAASRECKAIRRKLAAIVELAKSSFDREHPLRGRSFRSELRAVEGELETLLQDEIRMDVQSSVRSHRLVAKTVRLFARTFSLVYWIASVATGTAPVASGAFEAFADYLALEAQRPGPFEAFREKVVLSLDFRGALPADQ